MSDTGWELEDDPVAAQLAEQEFIYWITIVVGGIPLLIMAISAMIAWVII